MQIPPLRTAVLWIRLHLLPFLFAPAYAVAQVFQGGSVQQGVNQASGAAPVNGDDPYDVIVGVLTGILNVVGILAVAMIIIAGIYLIISVGNEERKEKAKKIIIYTLVGLTVILLSRVIVGLVTVYLADQV